MGIFDDEARKMAEEAEQKAQSEAERADGLNRIARGIAGDLQTDVVRRAAAKGTTIDTSIHGNVVRLTIGHRTLEIVCEGPDAFQLSDHNSGFQARVTSQPPRQIGTRAPISKSDMARRVLDWLEVHGAR